MYSIVWLLLYPAISPATAKYLRQAEGNKWRDVPRHDYDNYDQKLQDKYNEAVREMEEIAKIKLQEKYERTARMIDDAVNGSDDFQVFYEQSGFKNSPRRK